MLCIKCKKTIPEDSLYCNYCGKKQTAAPAKTHKRGHGQGSITKDKRYKNPWIAHAPATRYGGGRTYLGSFPTRNAAQEAIENYLKSGRSELWNATLAEVYELWAETHYKSVSDSAVKLYSCMWKRFEGISAKKMRDLRTADYQDIVNAATSKSACDTIKALALMINRCAMENDIIVKNYAEFIKIPKFEKKEKRIFSKDEIAKLWENSHDKRVQAVLLMIYTGFRIGEIVALKVGDIDLDKGIITGGEKTSAGKDRIVPIPPNIPELSSFLKNFIEQSKNDRLFQMTVSQFRDQVFYGALIYCRIPERGLTPHSTRHTFASLSAAAGMRPENLSKIIGHSDFSTTAEVYIHQDVDTLLKEMSKIKK